MADDIVTRLRQLGIDNPPTKEMFVTPDEAADEIERLRKYVKELEATISIMKRTQETQTKIVQKLREK